MPQKPKLLILTGTTASGKSAFAYANLQAHPVTLINADSKQVYRDLRILSASPTEEEKSLLPHALYNFLDVDEVFSAGRFCKEATQRIAEAERAGRIPVLCGGTYFYIQSLLQGLLPEITILPAVRRRVEGLDIDSAYRLLCEIDPIAAGRVHAHNRVRVNRQLMLALSVQGPISSVSKIGGIAEKYDILMLIFEPPKEFLLSAVKERTHNMFASGILEEVEAAMVSWLSRRNPTDWRKVPAFTSIGIQEFFSFYEETNRLPTTLAKDEVEKIAEQIVKNTMYLIKKQRTWFKNAPGKPKNTKTVDPSYGNARIAALVGDFFRDNT